MPLRMVSNLRMLAVSASFLGLPAASNRWWNRRITGLCRLANNGAMLSTARTRSRPLETALRPRMVPLDWFMGATPNRAPFVRVRTASQHAQIRQVC